jgi:hypothetical protein
MPEKRPAYVARNGSQTIARPRYSLCVVVVLQGQQTVDDSRICENVLCCVLLSFRTVLLSFRTVRLSFRTVDTSASAQIF